MISAIMFSNKKKQTQLYICTLSVLPGSKTCADIRCENGGSCVEVTGGGVKCTCTSGFTGTHCEKRTLKSKLIVVIVMDNSSDCFSISMA